MKNDHNLSRALIPDSRNLTIWINALIMLSGLFVFNWRPEMLVLAYFTETIIIGVLHVIRMIVIHKHSPAEKAAATASFNAHGSAVRGAFTIIFFILHYFFFVAIQSIFIFAFARIEFGEIRIPFDLISNYAWMMKQADALQAFGLLAITLIIQQLYSYYLPRRYLRQTLKSVFMQPYLRVIIQQFVVILAGAFVFFSQSMAAAVILILIRLLTDLYLNAASKSERFRERLISKLVRNEGDRDEETRQKEELRSLFGD